VRRRSLDAFAGQLDQVIAAQRGDLPGDFLGERLFGLLDLAGLLHAVARPAQLVARQLGLGFDVVVGGVADFDERLQDGFDLTHGGPQ
jgi:hypothetical protein